MLKGCSKSELLAHEVLPSLSKDVFGPTAETAFPILKIIPF